ncbi:hypothetical protein [Halogeometricum sp. CBA1124]|uniref:hypothetical protein n=1 Tax=Halogeometricum sp. CBA1124 TaxID=2668071 RepID=UPI0031B70EFE
MERARTETDETGEEGESGERDDGGGDAVGPEVEAENRRRRVAGRVSGRHGRESRVVG